MVAEMMRVCRPGGTVAMLERGLTHLERGVYFRCFAVLAIPLASSVGPELQG
jgi:hypothetical protein